MCNYTLAHFVSSTALPVYPSLLHLLVWIISSSCLLSHYSFTPFLTADCAGCGAEIKQGQSLLALEKQWHVSCFRCRTCNMVLTGEYISKWVCEGISKYGILMTHNCYSSGFDSLCCRDGVPYCEADYHAQYGVKCETCSRYISGRVLEVRTRTRYKHDTALSHTEIVRNSEI